MAGKKYRARDKTVQKMGRNGLMEENLHTGKSRRAVSGRADAMRIGDRPMEHPAGTMPDAESLTENGKGRPYKDSFREPGAGRRYGESRGGSKEAGIGEAENKKRKTKTGEPRSAEAPSSLSEDAGDARWAEERDTDGTGDELFSQKFHQDTYHTALRQERGTEPLRQSEKQEGRGKGYLDSREPDSSGRRKQVMRRRQTRDQKGTARMDVKNRGGVRESLPEGTKAAQVPTEGTEAAGYEDTEDAPAEERGAQEGTPGHSSRGMQTARGHPGSALRNAPLYSGGLLTQSEETREAFGKERGNDRRRLRETSSEMDGLDSLKEEISSKRKKERLNQEQRRAGNAARLSFDDEGGMVKGSGTGYSRKGKSAAGTAAGLTGGVLGKAAGTAAAAVAAEVREAGKEDENAGTQAAGLAGTAAQASARQLASRPRRISGSRSFTSRQKAQGRSRLLFTEQEDIKSAAASAKTEKEKKAAVRQFFKKQRQRRMIAAAKKEEKTIARVFREQQGALQRAASIVRDAVVKRSGAFLAIGLTGLIFLIVSASLGSCMALVQGAGNTMVSTTYPSTDEDIYAVENRYRELEAGLDLEVRRMQETHPTYDEFRFQIDEITHNPYHLISYFTTKYGQFTYEQVKDEIEEIFREQYTLTTSGERGVTITETTVVHPGESLGQVTTSGYCPCEICCGQYAGGPTASGVYPLSNHTIAVDAYNPFVPLGTHVIMNGIEYVVEDTGAFDQYDVQFDVFYDDHESAASHGQQVWDAILAEGGGIEELELTTTRTVDRMSVVLTNHDLDTVLQNRLTDNEKVRYNIYNLTYGNRDYLFDLDNLPKYGNASRDYTIPPEALSDERFARMIAEAERHLGTPYVWGGYDPSGFDCSGFVCWVVNHCGNGWDIGRTTAEGIRQKCYYVSPEDAKPGDIIFFENTYSCAGASHVGIYVGDGMMIHCGEPVQYTSLSSYWQEHFMQFGRLP